jgi:hypothetical protein
MVDGIIIRLLDFFKLAEVEQVLAGCVFWELCAALSAGY